MTHAKQKYSLNIPFHMYFLVYFAYCYFDVLIELRFAAYKGGGGIVVLKKC